MTNTEAVTKLTNIMHDDHYSWSPTVLAAFGMAVDALKGAGGDCISRAVASDVMEQWLYDGEDNRTVREVIYELPSAYSNTKEPSQRVESVEIVGDSIRTVWRGQ